MPAENEADLEELSDDVRESLDVILVSELEEVLATAIPAVSKEETPSVYRQGEPRQVEPKPKEIPH